MAIRKEEEKKIGMKITDNMDGEKKANEKLNMQTAELSDKMSIPQINKSISAYQAGDPIKAEDLVKDKVFISAGDKKEPATVEEINNYLKEIKEGK